MVLTAERKPRPLYSTSSGPSTCKDMIYIHVSYFFVQLGPKGVWKVPEEVRSDHVQFIVEMQLAMLSEGVKKMSWEERSNSRCSMCDFVEV